MSKAEVVDIVVLNWNNKGYIEKCVESIHKNTDGEYNLIVVDQGSNDGTKEWLRDKGRLTRLIENEANVGAWEGRNQGVREGKSDLIVFFDSDTEIRDSRWLQKILEAARDEKVGYVEARVQTWDGKYRFGGFASCLVKRAVFWDIGLFDRHFLIGGDNIFWVKFAWLDKWKIAWCDETDIFHYCGKTIVSGELKDGADGKTGKFYREELLRSIYTEYFLGRTVAKLNQRRYVEEQKRRWREP